MLNLSAVGASLLFGVAGSAWGAGEATDIRAQQSAAAIVAAFPGVSTYATGPRVTTVYGPAFARGATPEAAALAVLKPVSQALGSPLADLAAGSLAEDDAHIRPLMPDAANGGYKFNVVGYRQSRDGIRVWDADVLCLVRNTADNQVVLVRNNLRDLGNFRVNAGLLDAISFDQLFLTAQQALPGVATFSAPEPVVFAGSGDDVLAPALAMTFIAEGGDKQTGDYQKWRVMIDAQTGQVIWTENQIHQANVTGVVNALATEQFKADICGNEISRAMPYARVSTGSTVAYADGLGNFTLPTGGSTPVTLSAEVRGLYFRVYNDATNAGVETLTPSATPGTPVSLLFDSANTDASFQRSGVNAYIQANTVRDYVLKYAPTYPVIPSQSETTSGGVFRVNVNVSGTCNAFYDGTSINFYPAGGGCPSTAYGDVVHHEYGHHVVQSGGSGQGQYGEGTGDTMGILISDQPVLGYGFQSNCSAGIRTADNALQYPQGSGVEIHTAGQLISGCWWATRNAFVAAAVPNYRDIVSTLAINAVALHRGDTITPQITIDALTLDDNNGNINDGTPHYSLINAGFSSHNMAAPALNLVTFNYPDGRPTTIVPGHDTDIHVTVSALGGTPVDGSATMTYAVNGGSKTTIPLTRLGANDYTATIPAQTCLNTVTYWISASTTGGGSASDPSTAPLGAYSVTASYNQYTRFSDNFESNTGWVATYTMTGGGAFTGQWQRGIPADQSGAAPTSDYDGSGQCWLTDNRAGSSVGTYDVDNGTVTLTSPTMDASGGAAYISYARWFSNDQGASPDDDQLRVDVSGNNGTTWTSLEVVGPNGGAEQHGGWYYKTYQVPSAAATNQFKIRFVTSDNVNINGVANAGSVVEAAIDAVSLKVLDCTPPPCPADFNGDGFVDFFDFGDFVTCFEGGACPAGKTADFNNDGFADFFDFSDFVTAFETGCP